MPYVQAPGQGESGPREAQYRRVQKQLLTDLTSARARQKDSIIRDRLRQDMVVTRVLRPGYGEVVVYEHEFVNPFGQEMVSGSWGLERNEHVNMGGGQGGASGPGGADGGRREGRGSGDLQGRWCCAVLFVNC